MADSGKEQFHYALPEADGHSRWDDLSRPAREAISGIADDLASADALLRGKENPEDQVKEALVWAEQELTDTLQVWQLYSEHLIRVPESVDELAEGHPRYAETVKRLYMARQALSRSTEVDVNGADIADSMHLVLVPWQDFHGAQPRLETHLERWRTCRGLVDMGDHIDPLIAGTIKNNEPFYRDPADPESLMTSRAYLEQAISIDGLWGIMLAQTSDAPGVQSKAGASPDQLTMDGKIHFGLAGWDMDAMGAYEWLSLTMQRYPEQPEERVQSSWLLANRTSTISGGARSGVPIAHWEYLADKIDMDNAPAGFSNRNAAPRLAVL